MRPLPFMSSDPAIDQTDQTIALIEASIRDAIGTLIAQLNSQGGDGWGLTAGGAKRRAKR